MFTCIYSICGILIISGLYIHGHRLNIWSERALRRIIGSRLASEWYVMLPVIYSDMISCIFSELAMQAALNCLWNTKKRRKLYIYANEQKRLPLGVIFFYIRNVYDALKCCLHRQSLRQSHLCMLQMSFITSCALDHLQCWPGRCLCPWRTPLVWWSTRPCLCWKSLRFAWRQRECY